MDDYFLALAYSNIQGEYNIPPIATGVLIFNEDLKELNKRNILKKDFIIHKKDSLNILNSICDDIYTYLYAYRSIDLKEKLHIKELERTYTALLNVIRSNLLRISLGNLESIKIRVFSSYDYKSKEWNAVSFSNEFIKYIANISESYEFIDDEYDDLLECAKLISRLEYEKKRQFNSDYIQHGIKQHPKNYNQIVRLKWPNAFVDDYYNENIGSPALIIRDVFSNIKYQYLSLFDNLTVRPLQKFCTGYQKNYVSYPCVKHSNEYPFGSPIFSGLEQCSYCKQVVNIPSCLIRKPLCNGYDAKCNNVEFAGRVCRNLYGVYITMLGNDLKVGTAFLTNIIGRLLDQGPNSAIVIYPIEGLWETYILERKIKEYLLSHIYKYSKWDIKNIYLRSPKKELILNNYIKNWKDLNLDLFRSIISDLSHFKEDSDEIKFTFSQAEHKIVMLNKNYVKPDLEMYPIPQNNLFFETISGNITGYRGRFVFLNDGNIIDVKQLNGYVVRGL